MMIYSARVKYSLSRLISTDTVNFCLLMVAMYLCVSACCGSADARQYKDRIPRRLWRWGDGREEGHGIVLSGWIRPPVSHNKPLLITLLTITISLHPILSCQMEGFYEMGATIVKVWKEYSWQLDGCKSKGCMSNNNSRCWLMMSVPDISTTLISDVWSYF